MLNKGTMRNSFGRVSREGGVGGGVEGGGVTVNELEEDKSGIASFAPVLLFPTYLSGPHIFVLMDASVPVENYFAEELPCEGESAAWCDVLSPQYAPLWVVRKGLIKRSWQSPHVLLLDSFRAFKPG